MHDVVTSAPRRAAYERAGLWDDRTLAGRVAGWAGSDPQRVAVVDEHGRHAVGEVFERARRVAGHLRAHGVEPGAVVSVQLPNRFEAVVDRGGDPVARRGREPAAAELPGPRARATCSRTARPGSHRDAGRAPRVRPPRRSSTRSGRATGVVPHHVVVDGDAGPGAATFADAEGAATDRRRRARRRRGLRADLHLGHRGHAQGDHAHRADGQLQRARRVRRPRARAGRRGVDAVAGRALDRLQLRPALRALPRAAARAAGHAGTATRPSALVQRERCSYTLAATTFLQDLVAASTRAGVRLDTLRCFGCGGAPVPPAARVGGGASAASACSASTASTEVLVGTWNRPDSPEAKRTRTDGTAMSHVELEVRGEDGTVSRRARRASCSCAVPTPASASSTTPSAPRPRSTATGGCAVGRPRHDRRRRLPHGRRPQEGDHHPRRAQHRAPRDRGAARRVPRGGAGGGGRPARRAAGRAHRARASCCTRGRPLDLEDDGRPPACHRPGRRTSSPNGSRCSTRCPRRRRARSRSTRSCAALAAQADA